MQAASTPCTYPPTHPPSTHLEDLEQQGEGGVDHALQRPPLLLVSKLKLAGQEAQGHQGPADPLLVLQG